MSLKSKVIAAVAGTTLLGGSITSVVKYNEGLSLTAYPDSGNVWTICYGETRGVKRGMVATVAQCNEQLRVSISEHAEALAGLPESLPDVVTLGAVDMSYNIGVGGFKGSTPRAELAMLDYKAAGDAVLWYKFISSKNKPRNLAGWVYSNKLKVWRYDCSQLVNGKPNKVCWGLWERRQWQSKAIGNEFKSVQEAIQALPK